jgi:hypothetical protein
MKKIQVGLTKNEIKEYLPDVKVKINGKVLNGKTGGRHNQFCTVYVNELGIKIEYSWNAIAYALNNQTYLKV